MKKINTNLLLLFIIISFASCNSIYYKGDIYVPVKRYELKYDHKYKSIKEIDSISYVGSRNPYDRAFRDTVLKSKQIIIDKINAINAKTDTVRDPKKDNKLYGLQEIAYGKYVRSNFKKDLKNDHLGYTKRKVGTIEIIFYALGLYAGFIILTTAIAFIGILLFIYLLFGTLS